MKVLIVEDEPLAVSRLEKMLLEIEPNIEVVDRLESTQEVIEFISSSSENIDLIFMDIHLSDGNSFEIFDLVEVDIPIIFTTAFNQYALEAFKQNSIDYLLKPIKQEQLSNAIDKFKKFFIKENDWTDHYKKVAALLNPSNKNKARQRFMVYAGNKIKSVKTEDIAYCYAESKAVFLATLQGQTYTLNYTMEKLEELLPSDSFHRVNRKTIVAFNAVQEVVPYSKSKLKLNLLPTAPFEVFVPLERMGKFKKWLEI